MSTPGRLAVSTVLCIGLVWALNTYVGMYFVLRGGPTAWIVVGALITLMNILVWPLLEVLTLPLRLFATLFAAILANSAFLWICLQIANRMDPSIVSLQIHGGLVGWIVLSLILGLGHWIMKEMLKER